MVNTLLATAQTRLRTAVRHFHWTVAAVQTECDHREVVRVTDCASIPEQRATRICTHCGMTEIEDGGEYLLVATRTTDDLAVLDDAAGLVVDHHVRKQIHEQGIVAVIRGRHMDYRPATINLKWDAQ